MRILIVNYFYEPMVDAHAYRWSQIASYWASQGHRVEVICSTICGDVESGHSGVKVKRIGLLPARISPIHPNGSSSSAQRKSGILSFLKTIYRKIFWPDGLWHWLPVLALELFRRRGDRYDFVVSYAPTFSAHLAILLYRRISRKPFIWIADYGDPFSTSNSMQPNNFKLYDRVNHLAEKRVLQNATMVSFTNEPTVDEYRARFGPLDKFKVFPHAVDVDAFHQDKYERNLENHSGSSAVRIVYVGGFHRNIREPYEMLDLFNRLSQVSALEFTLDIYGPLNGLDISQYLSSDIRWHGTVARERAICIIKNADILINIENRGCVMSPSKVVEYVATGNPVLNLLSGCGVTKLLEIYGQSGLVFNLEYEEVDSVLPQLIEFISIKKHSSMGRDVVDSILSGYTIKHIANKYLSVASDKQYSLFNAGSDSIH